MQYIYDGLSQPQTQPHAPSQESVLLRSSDDTTNDNTEYQANKIDLINAIADHPMVWTRIVLYRSSTPSSTTTTTICGALLPPPYLPHVSLNHLPAQTTTGNDDCIDEADCTGPFTFQYQWDALEHHESIDVSLLYISSEGVHKMIQTPSPNTNHDNTMIYLPTIDLVPSYQYPN